VIPVDFEEAVALNMREHGCETLSEYPGSGDLLAWFPQDAATVEPEALVKACGKVLFAVIPFRDLGHNFELRMRLSRHFRIVEWMTFPDEGKSIVTAQPLTAPRFDPIQMAGEIGERLLHIRANTASIAKRLEPKRAHHKTAALVCYGPSLRRTWLGAPHLRLGGATIVSTSGAHDFLLSRNVTPDYHVEMDPREHKAKFSEKPHAKVKYLIASCCHPKVFANLKGHDVALFHSDNGMDDQELIAEIDPRHKPIAGGSSVGLRAIYVLYAMGYRRFAIFGMDCSVSDEHHAGPHYGSKQPEISIDVGARRFKTTPLLAKYAEQFTQTVSALPDCVFSLYGDGLLQHMLKAGSRKDAA
jgi:uncharacterized Rossmann fold enzyme